MCDGLKVVPQIRYLKDLILKNYDLFADFSTTRYTTTKAI